jgi:hypothetical protein
MNIVKKIEQAVYAGGHQVDVKNALLERDLLRLSFYEYVAVIAPSQGPFTGKISSRISETLSTCGTVSGKKGCALIVKNGLFSQKACRNLMRVMEKEGMILDYFDIIENPEHATYIGKKLG